MPQLVFAVLNREGGRDRTNPDAGQDGDWQFDRVGQLDRHRITRLDAGRLQLGSDRVNCIVELSPAQPDRITAEEVASIRCIDERRMIGSGRGRLPHKSVDGRHGVEPYYARPARSTLHA
jgi:hypothetical protein